MKKKAYISFLILILIAFSFLRESVFLNINAHMWYLFNYGDKSYLSPLLSFLSPLSYQQFYWLKWGITVFFCLIFLFLYCIIISSIFKGKKFLQWTIFSFLSLVLVSAIAFVTGIIFNKSETGYTISRFFMGMIQSPFLLIFLIPAFKLAEPSEIKILNPELKSVEPQLHRD